MCKNCEIKNQVAELEIKRLLNKIAKYFPITKEVATTKAVVNALQLYMLSADKCVEEEAKIEFLTSLGALRDEDEINRAKEYIKEKNEMVASMLMDNAFIIYNLNTDGDVEEYYSKFKEYAISFGTFIVHLCDELEEIKTDH